MFSNDITEWSEMLRGRFGIDEYFDVVVISDRAKARKPDPGIYEYFSHLLQERSIKPSQIYYVDDSLKNLEPAREFGWKTVYKIIKSNDEHTFSPDHRISRLNELLPIVLNPEPYDIDA